MCYVVSCRLWSRCWSANVVPESTNAWTSSKTSLCLPSRPKVRMSASWRRPTFLSSQCVICTNYVASMLLALRPRPRMRTDSERVSPTALRRCRIILPLQLHRPPTHSTSTLRLGRSCFNTWGPAFVRLTARQPASYNRRRTLAPPPHNVTIMCTPHQHPLTSRDQFHPPPRTCWWSLKPNRHILLYGDRGSHCLTSHLVFIFVNTFKWSVY